MRLYGLLEEASEIGKVDLSGLKLPDFSNLKVPETNLPPIEIPSMGALQVPKIDVTVIGNNFDANLVMPMAGVSVSIVVLLGLLAVGSNKVSSSSASKKSKKTKSTPLDIPYHAPAQLAYAEWLEAHPEESWDDAAYQSFQTLFESHAVAEATAKKLKRDMESFANKPLPDAQPRRILEKTIKPVGRFFFASDS